MENKEIGLALSGGGVRAAAFHLGVLDKLNELGILKRVDVISTVSGGSIIGAFYMTQKDDFQTFKNLMIQNLKQNIETKALLNWRMLLCAVNPSYSRTDVVAEVYNKLYFNEKNMSDLPEYPKLIINATSLTTGKGFMFSQKYMGDWIIGEDGVDGSFPLAKAVAASSAVPGLLYPLKVKIKDYFPNANCAADYLALCDGGVYDNQGTHSLTSDYGKNEMCDYIICSDASAPFDSTPKDVSLNLPEVLLRQSDVAMARIRNMQFQDLMYGQFKDKIKTAYFSINWTVDGFIKSILKQKDLCNSLGLGEIIAHIDIDAIEKAPFDDPAYLKVKQDVIKVLNYPEFSNCLTQEEVEFVSAIGTSLKSLSDKEIELLSRQASVLCGIQVRTYLRDLLS